MTILGKETPILFDQDRIFVRAQGKITVGPYELKHANLAENDKVFNSLGSTKPWVDDGGVFIERTDRIEISPYFTTSCVVQAFADADSLPEKPVGLDKIVRRETGQMFASHRGKIVIIHHRDHTQETITPP